MAIIRSILVSFVLIWIAFIGLLVFSYFSDNVYPYIETYKAFTSSLAVDVGNILPDIAGIDDYIRSFIKAI